MGCSCDQRGRNVSCAECAPEETVTLKTRGCGRQHKGICKDEPQPGEPPKLPVRIDPDNDLTKLEFKHHTDRAEGVGYIIGKLVLLRTRGDMLHIMADDQRDIRRVCDNTYAPADDIAGFVHMKDGKWPPICVKCRRAIESGEKRYRGQPE